MQSVRRIGLSSLLRRSRLFPLWQESAINVKSIWSSGIWAAPPQPSNQPNSSAQQSSNTKKPNEQSSARRCPCSPKKKPAGQQKAALPSSAKPGTTTTTAAAAIVVPSSSQPRPNLDLPKMQSSLESTNKETENHRLQNAYHSVVKSNEFDVLRTFMKSVLNFGRNTFRVLMRKARRSNKEDKWLFWMF